MLNAEPMGLPESESYQDRNGHRVRRLLSFKGYNSAVLAAV